jgi:hypothetical protein
MTRMKFWFFKFPNHIMAASIFCELFLSSLYDGLVVSKYSQLIVAFGYLCALISSFVYPFMPFFYDC